MDATVEIPGLEEFLYSQPFISIQPSHNGRLVLEGDFELNHQVELYPSVTDRYRLRITLHARFPKDLPIVNELAGRIPPVADYHNGNGTLCLGSPLRLVIGLHEEPNLLAFSRRFIVPYLYAMSLKLDHGINFVFGELKHGIEGEVDDYFDLFGLKSMEQVASALLCLLKKKRIANKMPCPCGCKLRLGKCRYSNTIRKLRRVLPKDRISDVLKDWGLILSAQRKQCRNGYA